MWPVCALVWALEPHRVAIESSGYLGSGDQLSRVDDDSKLSVSTSRVNSDAEAVELGNVRLSPSAAQREGRTSKDIMEQTVARLLEWLPSPLRDAARAAPKHVERALVELGAAPASGGDPALGSGATDEDRERAAEAAYGFTGTDEKNAGPGSAHSHLGMICLIYVYVAGSVSIYYLSMWVISLAIFIGVCKGRERVPKHARQEKYAQVDPATATIEDVAVCSCLSSNVMGILESFFCAEFVWAETVVFKKGWCKGGIVGYIFLTLGVYIAGMLTLAGLVMMYVAILFKIHDASAWALVSFFVLCTMGAVTGSIMYSRIKMHKETAPPVGGLKDCFLSCLHHDAFLSPACLCAGLLGRAAIYQQAEYVEVFEGNGLQGKRAEDPQPQ